MEGAAISLCLCCHRQLSPSLVFRSVAIYLPLSSDMLILLVCPCRISNRCSTKSTSSLPTYSTLTLELSALGY